MLNGFVMTVAKPQLSEAELRAAAGDRSFERGARYVAAVSGLELAGNQVIATVRGSEDYLVVLTLDEDSRGGSGEGRLRGECGCPYGQQGFFCKHCVAVGLSLLARSRRRRGSSGPAAGIDVSSGKLSAWLGALSRDELLAVVCDQVVEDEDWRRRLELKAASAAADPAAISDRAVRLLRADDGPFRNAARYGYLDGPDTSQFARRVRAVTDVIRDLTRAGRPADAMGVAAQAIAAVAESSRHAADRAGVIGAAAAELAAAHQEACEAAAADPGEVLAVYGPLIDALTTQTGGRGHEQIARLLESARACLRRLGTEAAFDAYLKALRDDLRRDRKLMEVLDAHQLWPR
jgi:uncharacterized Zn finger protein